MYNKLSKVLILFILVATSTNGMVKPLIAPMSFVQNVEQHQHPEGEPPCHGEYTLEESETDPQCELDSLLCIQFSGILTPSIEVKSIEEHSSVLVTRLFGSPVHPPRNIYRPPRSSLV